MSAFEAAIGELQAIFVSRRKVRLHELHRLWTLANIDRNFWPALERTWKGRIAA